MFDRDWSQPDAAPPLAIDPQDARSRLAAACIRRTALLRWEEHCLECSVPQCYGSCPLYTRREDGACARFVYGIARNRNVRGLLGWGADIQFRRWAKLETGVHLYPVSPITHRLLGGLDRIFSGARNCLIALAPKRFAYGLHWRYASYRNRLLRCLSRLRSGDYDALVIECFSPHDRAFQLVMEYRDSTVRCRDSFRIAPGMNLHVIPAEHLGVRDADPKSRLTVYPENDAEVRILFTCLDLIQWQKGYDADALRAKAALPSSKVKCIAWDLDNTLWSGILVEDGPAKLRVQPEVVAAIEEFDRRGILHTVVSKNDHQQAWPVVERMGLADYFVYPAINWADKGSNIVQVSQRLNIGIDSIALVDDCAFERAAVQHALPEVRVYSDRDPNSTAPSRR